MQRKTPALFNTHNVAFNSLIQSLMEVKHELLEIKEVRIPNIDITKLRNVNNWLSICADITYMNNKDYSIPNSFHGFERGQIIRIMPHFDSPEKDIEYLYHPWHGSDDNYRDWFQYRYKNLAWKIMDNFFRQKHKTDEYRFKHTEYTNLKRKHSLKVKELQQLEYLLSYINSYGPDSQFLHNKISKQGHYYMQKFANGESGLPTFIESEFCKYWRDAYMTNDEKRTVLETQISQLQNKLNSLKEELSKL